MTGRRRDMFICKSYKNEAFCLLLSNRASTITSNWHKPSVLASNVKPEHVISKRGLVYLTASGFSLGEWECRCCVGPFSGTYLYIWMRTWRQRALSWTCPSHRAHSRHHRCSSLPQTLSPPCGVKTVPTTCFTLVMLTFIPSKKCGGHPYVGVIIVFSLWCSSPRLNNYWE